jgi:hypothetical protein
VPGLDRLASPSSTSVDAPNARTIATISGNAPVTSFSERV